MKKATSIILLLTIVFSLAASVYGSDIITPRWDNTAAVYASIEFDGTEGMFIASIVGHPYATDIYMVAWLYYKDSNGNWIEKTRWAGMAVDSYLGMEKTFTGVSGVEYKVDYTVYVYAGTNCDEINFTTYETCP